MNSLLAGFLLWIDTARVIWKERISWGSLSSLLIRLGTELFMPSAQSKNVKTIRSKITLSMSKSMLYKSIWRKGRFPMFLASSCAIPIGKRNRSTLSQRQQNLFNDRKDQVCLLDVRPRWRWLHIQRGAVESRACIDNTLYCWWWKYYSGIAGCAEHDGGDQCHFWPTLVNWW